MARAITKHLDFLAAGQQPTGKARIPSTTKATSDSTEKKDKKMNLTPAQVTILAYLAKHDPLPVASIRVGTKLAESTVRDNLKALEKARRVHRVDGRWTTSERKPVAPQTSKKPDQETSPNGQWGSRGNRALARERDEKVLGVIKADGPISTAEIAEKTGMTHDLAYLSIWRMLKAKVITKHKTAGTSKVTYTVS